MLIGGVLQCKDFCINSYGPEQVENQESKIPGFLSQILVKFTTGLVWAEASSKNRRSPGSQNLCSNSS